MISSEQNCWVFALEQKKRKEKERKTVLRSVAEVVLLSCSEFNSQYVQDSKHESSWLRLLMVVLRKRKKSMIFSEQNYRVFVSDWKKKPVFATESVLLFRSKFKSQQCEQNSELKSTWLRLFMLLLEKRKKIDDFVRPNCEEYLF